MNRKEYPRRTHQQDTWFVVEWDGEDCSYTAVAQKFLVGNTNPSEGDKVTVKEGRSKNVFCGVVLKKGCKAAVDAYMEAEEERQEQQERRECEECEQQERSEHEEEKEQEQQERSEHEEEKEREQQENEMVELGKKRSAKKKPTSKAKQTKVDIENKEAKKLASQARIKRKEAKQKADKAMIDAIFLELDDMTSPLPSPHNNLTPPPHNSLSLPVPTNLTSPPSNSLSSLVPNNLTSPPSNSLSSLVPTNLTTTPQNNELSVNKSNPVQLSSTASSDFSSPRNAQSDAYRESILYRTVMDIQYEVRSRFTEMQQSIDDLKKQIKHKAKKGTHRQERTQFEVDESHVVSAGSSDSPLPTNGVLLGKSVWIDGININQITHAENVSPTPQKLAVSLLLALFPHEELASGNCTTPKRADINLLDQSKIKGIRAHVNYKFPMSTADEENARWKKILQINLNGKCRTCRVKL